MNGQLRLTEWSETIMAVSFTYQASNFGDPDYFAYIIKHLNGTHSIHKHEI